MNVWILQTGEPLHIDNGSLRPMRAINLSNKLSEAGHNVVIFSADFNHQQKYHRTNKYTAHKVNENIEIRLIPSIGYSKHIGIRRLIDHFQLAWNLKKILKKEENIPDVAFIGYPPIETASVMSKWLKAKKVPMLLDVKDLWPVVFVDSFPTHLRPFAKVLFYVYYYLAKKTMKNASGISTMSEGFLKWTLAFSDRSESISDKIVRLTSLTYYYTNEELKLAKKYWKSIGIENQSPIVFFIGTFSTSFDFDKIYIAAKKMNKCQFILCGDGPCLDEIKDKMSDLSNVFFTGWIDNVKMKSLSEISIASIAPYKNLQNFTLNIPNKIVDSLLMGLPILCPLGGEVKKLVNKYNIGYIYGPELSLAKCIETLIKNKDLQATMSANAYKLYNTEFEFNYVYDNLVRHLEFISKK
jgi:glycosyltransferase involved in cell wall biosynthesis